MRHLDCGCCSNYGVCIQHHVATGLQGHDTTRTQLALPIDGDGATTELATANRQLQLGLRPVHIYAGVHVYPVVGRDNTADVQYRSSVEKDATSRWIILPTRHFSQHDTDCGHARTSRDIDLRDISSTYRCGVKPTRGAADFCRQARHDVLQSVCRSCRLAKRQCADLHLVDLPHGERKTLHINSTKIVGKISTGRINGNQAGFYLTHDADGRCSKMDQLVSLDNGLSLGVQRSRHRESIARTHVHLGVSACSPYIAAGQHINICRRNTDCISHVHVTQNRNIAAAGSNIEQANFCRSKIALPYYAFNRDTVGGKNSDRAPCSSVEHATRNAVLGGAGGCCNDSSTRTCGDVDLIVIADIHAGDVTCTRIHQQLQRSDDIAQGLTNRRSVREVGAPYGYRIGLTRYYRHASKVNGARLVDVYGISHTNCRTHQHQRCHEHAYSRGVGTALNSELVVCGYQCVQKHLRKRTNRDVGTHIVCSYHVVQLNGTVCPQRDKCISTRRRFAPNSDIASLKGSDGRCDDGRAPALRNTDST